MSAAPNPYEVLGVDEWTPFERIESAFRRLYDECRRTLEKDDIKRDEARTTTARRDSIKRAYHTLCRQERDGSDRRMVTWAITAIVGLLAIIIASTLIMATHTHEATPGGFVLTLTIIAGVVMVILGAKTAGANRGTRKMAREELKSLGRLEREEREAAAAAATATARRVRTP